MKGDPEQRAIQLGEYIAAHRTTVRAAVQQIHSAQGRGGTAADAAAGAVPAGAGCAGPQQSRAASARRRSYPAQIQPQMRDGALSVFIPEACRLFYCRFWGWNWLSAPFSNRLTCA